MKAGFSRICINPKVGDAMEGLAQKGGCNEIHDDLNLGGLWLEEGTETVLIIGCDLLFFQRTDMDRLKGALGRRFDLLPRQIFFNVSHNHAGPRLTTWAYSEGAEPVYLDSIETALLTVAGEARARLQEATLHAGMTESNVPMSRRRIGVDGKCAWAPAPESPTCKALPVALLRGVDGSVISLLFSVSCHPSTWYANSISADFPGVAQSLLNAHYATEGALFLQGCGGDSKAKTIGQDSNGNALNAWVRDRGFEPVAAAGREIADAVIACETAGLREIQPELRAVYTDTLWPLKAAPERAALEPIAAKRFAPDDWHARKEILWAREQLDRLERTGVLPSEIRVGMHGVQLGRGLRLIGLEGEAVAELGTVMLSCYDNGVTFPLGYTDGAQVYLPVSHMHEEGGYEVESFAEYHWPAELEPGEETIVAAQLRAWQDDGSLLNVW